MLTHLLRKLPTSTTVLLRRKTTSAAYVSSRPRDPTFEKLMEKYKNLFKAIAIAEFILATPTTHSVALSFLQRLSQRLHLHRGPTHFLTKHPHVFHHPVQLQPHCTLTQPALDVFKQEEIAIHVSMSEVVNRLVRVLAMSLTRTVPLRAVFKVSRELGLPDDFEENVIKRNSNIFALVDNSTNEPNTHLLKLLVDVNGLSVPVSELVAEVDKWRIMECSKGVDRSEILYSFKHSYPPGMKLKRSFKDKVKEWQMLKYVGPYDVTEIGGKKKESKIGMMEKEKRAVGIVHEFLSLTVEKMVEVEKISHFRKWFGIDLNIRDLFLDHLGMFYLSTKGYRHTVFLREAYERGCLIEPNPVYEARRKLLDFVILGRRGLSRDHCGPTSVSQGEDDED